MPYISDDSVVGIYLKGWPAVTRTPTSSSICDTSDLPPPPTSMQPLPETNNQTISASATADTPVSSSTHTRV